MVLVTGGYRGGRNLPMAASKPKNIGAPGPTPMTLPDRWRPFPLKVGGARGHRRPRFYLREAGEGFAILNRQWADGVDDARAHPEGARPARVDANGIGTYLAKFV